jgi:murein DD-endopeptidase MepM/ murein hydrolase activator NlpD
MSAVLDSVHFFARAKRPQRIIIAYGDHVRTFTIRPWLIAALCGAALVFGFLYLCATGYLVFHDDLLGASISRQARMQRAYEDRIATLRSDLDRVTSRQLLNQQAVESEMNRIASRQSALDARQDSIAALSQAVRSAGVPVGLPAAAAADSQEAAPDAANTPASDSEDTDPQTTGAVAPVQASVVSPLSFNLPLRLPGAAAPSPSSPSAGLASVDASLDKLARDQTAYVDSVAFNVSERADKIARILTQLGQRVPPSHTPASADIGGPLVDIDDNADPGTFRSSVDLIAGEVDRFGVIRRMATQLPLSRPFADAMITSGFGARLDPFLGRPALHTGVDFRAAAGSPARATAGGTVIIAGYTGGYGNMVEIDHGNGITTRYGHLSEIDVTVGQVVAKDAIIGHTGSTGRSTGPHLHYEVRVDGAPIDPMTFINAGHNIASLL